MSLSLQIKPVLSTLLGTVAAGLIACLIARFLPDSWRVRLQREAGLLARRPWLSAALLGGGIALARIALLPIAPVPVPLIPDEFSYLLLGSTLAAGRLANPVFPLPDHFQTLFVLSRPTYSSVYPIAQGLFLALGQVVSQPWSGVLLSIGLMCACIYWMLRGWMPARWALFGGGIAALQFGLFSYWVNGYWGGAPAAIGGALALGAVPRLNRGARYFVLLGIGFGILANSRPYEGCVLALSILGVVSRRWYRRLAEGSREALVREIAPLAATCLLIAAFDLFYFYRITGNAFEMPYQTYIRQFAAAPAFVWQPLPAPGTYADETLQLAHRSFLLEYRRTASIPSFVADRAQRIGKVAVFYFGPMWIVVALALPALLRSGRTRFLAVTSGVGVAAICLSVPFQLHYAAPFTACFAGLTTGALRWLSNYRPNRVRIGRVVVTAAPAIVLWTAIQASTAPLLPSHLASRPALVQRLRQAGGKHLVFVEYGANHAFRDEWVYNEPDPNRAAIVWARNLGSDRNRELVRLFPGRSVWLLRPDDAPIELLGYQ